MSPFPKIYMGPKKDTGFSWQGPGTGDRTVGRSEVDRYRYVTECSSQRTGTRDQACTSSSFPKPTTVLPVHLTILCSGFRPGKEIPSPALQSLREFEKTLGTSLCYKITECLSGLPTPPKHTSQPQRQCCS